MCSPPIAQKPRASSVDHPHASPRGQAGAGIALVMVVSAKVTKKIAGALIASAILTLSPSASAQEPLTLARAVELGRARVPEIAAARAQVASAAADADTARAAYLPTLSASVNAQGLAVRDVQPAPPRFDGVAPVTSYTTAGAGSVALRWTLFDFGKTATPSTPPISRHGRRGRARRCGGGERGARRRDRLRHARVPRGGPEQLTSRSLSRSARSSSSSRRRSVKAGLQPQVEELRASSRLEAARRELAGAETDAQDIRAVLTLLLGVEQGVRVVAPRLPVVDAEPARARLAEERRETIRAARSNLQAKDAAARRRAVVTCLRSRSPATGRTGSPRPNAWGS